jgi:hypothetical protein
MPDPTQPPAGYDSPFAERLERLVTLLRGGGEVGSAAETAAREAAAGLIGGPVVLEAGVENSAGWEDASLKGRLLRRQVDSVRVAPGVAGDELLALARSLASDSAPIENSAHVTVELIPIAPPPPPAFDAPRRGSPALATSAPAPPAIRREHTGDNLSDLITTLTRGLTEGLQRGAIREALHAAQGLIRILPGVPEHSRRGVAISIRRYLTRPVLETFLQFALRTPEEQTRVGEVLRWAGLDGAEVMLQVVRESEAIGPRAFLLDALGTMPEAYPIIGPLLQSSRWHEVRHAADLAGRLLVPEALGPLRSQLNHPDERVRTAVIEAIARFPDKGVVEPLRQCLAHPSPLTRMAAGRALAGRGSSALAMLLLAALEAEKDAAVWHELLGAMSRIDASEAVHGLVRLATERKALLRRRGRPVSQRLEVVAALAQAGTPSARQALARIAAEADAPLRRAAHQALERLGSSPSAGAGR